MMRACMWMLRPACDVDFGGFLTQDRERCLTAYRGAKRKLIENAVVLQVGAIFHFRNLRKLQPV
jgi:hypothetical protein